MLKSATPYVLTSSRQVYAATENEISRVHRKDPLWGESVFVITDMMNVYQSFSILEILTGQTREIWLTADQLQWVRQERSSWTPQHPRASTLAEIGVFDQDVPCIEGYAHGTTYHVLQDKGGHWWSHGALNSIQSCWTPSKNNKPPTLSFTMPWLKYIGQDSDELYTAHWQETNRTNQITISTRPVRQVIDQLRMLNVYFPEGKARVDPELARKQCIELRDSHIATRIEKGDAAIEQLEAATTTAEQATSQLYLAQQKIQQLTSELNRIQQLDLEVEVEELREQVASDQQKIRSLRESLETARMHNTGWDWSRVLGEDD